MSSKLHGLVWEGCAFTGMILSRVAVMARLADYSNDEGVSWPAVETIRRQIGAKSESTVKTAIAELERDGWLNKTERKAGGRSLSNVYQINVEKLEAAAAVARKEYKHKRGGVKIDPPIIAPSTIDPSTVDPSTVDEITHVEGAIVDPDPSLSSKQDPSVKISCQAEVPDDPAQMVLDHFNQVTNSRYRDGKTTMGYIRGRLTEPDYVAEDLIQVVDYLTAKWLNDRKMCDFLRPKTIFAPENFPEYYDKARKWDASGRPACVDGKWIRPGDMSAVPIDVSERDAAYRRFIGSALPAKNPSKIEIQVRTEASKAGLKSAKSEFAMSRWNCIWKDVTQRQQGGKAA